MFEPIKQRFNRAVATYNLNNFKDIAIFIVLILIFTMVGYIWKHLFNYKLFGVQVLEPLYRFLIKYIVLISYWILTTVFSIHMSYNIETSRLYFTDVSYIYIYHGCSGLKEMAMFLFIMLLFPGKLKAKLWFIPVSLLLIYFVAILRIVFLGLSFKFQPGWFNFLHEFLLNVLFFIIFFLLWLAWVKWFYKRGANSNRD